jgi:MSHA biogenesis protein MshQ
MIGNTLDARFGRLFTRDTHGPESAPLKVPFQTEYWTNGQFVINTSDSCTRIARTDIAFDTETIDINLDAPVGAGTTTGSFANLDATHITMSAGDAELLFSAPNTSGSFPLDVDLTLMPWLRFDWNQNGDHGDDAQLPAATVSFGHYRGHDRIIYWQEQFR